MPRVLGRPQRQTDRLKEMARDLALGRFSNIGILEQLNETQWVGDSPVNETTLRRWLNEELAYNREALISTSYDEVMYLRSRAHRATAMTDLNRAHSTERAYWWGLYVSCLHIILRQAVTAEAAGKLPPQFFVQNISEWYAEIRAIRQMTPPLALPEGELDSLADQMEKFAKDYGRNIKLPSETL